MFKKNIKKFRKELGITQTVLAQKIEEETGKHCSTENIKSWESGVNPKIEMIEALATALNKPIQLLFNDNIEELEKVNCVREEKILYGSCKRENVQITDAYKNEYYEIDPRFVESIKGGELFFLKIETDALRPTLKKNDTAIFKKIESMDRLDNGLYILESAGTFRVREIFFLSDGSFQVGTGESKETVDNVGLFGVVVGRVVLD